MAEKEEKKGTRIENKFEHPLVLDVYNNKPNYEIVINEKSNSDLCVIYFSSNGLYTEDTVETFNELFVKKNRFEWKNNRIEEARKHIFVRDIFKSTYILGINKNLYTLHKVIEFLREETKGMRVVTLGSSSGGYAAVVAGVMLNADYVFSFTGQFSMFHHNIQHPYDFKRDSLIYKHRNEPERRQYYNILDTYMMECNIPIFYFSSQERLDVTQKYLVQSFDNIFTFDMKTKDHRFPVYVFNFYDIINMNKMDLLRLGYKFYDRKISRFELSREVSGLGKTLKGLMGNMSKGAKKKVFKQFV